MFLKSISSIPPSPGILYAQTAVIPFSNFLGHASLFKAETYGMEVGKLSVEDKRDIIQQLNQLGFKNANANDLTYFYSKPSQIYLDKLSNSKFDEDRQFVDQYREGLIPENTTNKSYCDNCITAFIDPDFIKRMTKAFAKSEEEVRRNHALHEVVHIPLYDLTYKLSYVNGKRSLDRQSLMAGELIADYIAMQVGDAQDILLTHMCFRNDPFKIYTSAQSALEHAFKEVFETIDEEKGRKILVDTTENPISLFRQKLDQTDFENSNETLGSIYSKIMSNIFEKHFKGMDAAPRTSKELMSRVLNQFRSNMKAQAEDLARFLLSSKI